MEAQESPSQKHYDIVVCHMMYVINTIAVLYVCVCVWFMWTFACIYRLSIILVIKI